MLKKGKKRLVTETNNNLGSFRFLNSSEGIQNMKEKGEIIFKFSHEIISNLESDTD